MESEGIKFETIFDDINHLKAEKCRLEERLKTVRVQRARKEAILSDVSRKRASVTNLLAKQGESLKLIQHRVTQQQTQQTNLRREVALKAESIKEIRAEVEQLKNRQKSDSDKFDAQLQSVYCDVKNAWEFYSPANLEVETANVIDTQKSVSSEIQVTAQKVANVLDKLQVEDDEDDDRELLVAAEIQHMIQSVFSDDDQATIKQLDELNQQTHLLLQQIEDLT